MKYTELSLHKKPAKALECRRGSDCNVPKDYFSKKRL